MTPYSWYLLYEHKKQTTQDNLSKIGFYKEYAAEYKKNKSREMLPAKTPQIKFRFKKSDLKELTNVTNLDPLMR